MNFIKLLLKNKEKEPKTYEAVYGSLVEQNIRRKYSQRDVEAILNNYLAEPDNITYQQEFKDLQTYRKQCKDEVKGGLVSGLDR